MYGAYSNKDDEQSCHILHTTLVDTLIKIQAWAFNLKHNEATWKLNV